MQEYVRNHCTLAKEFQAKVEQDSRFRLMNDVKVKMTFDENEATDTKVLSYLARISLLPTFRIKSTKPETFDHHKCIGKASHGPSKCQ